MFAEKYLKRHLLFKNHIKTVPNNDLNIIVVIPCFNEPDILNSIKSLFNCVRPQCSIEVLLVLNSSETANTDEINQNLESHNFVSNWSKDNSEEKLNLHIIHCENLPEKQAGVGLARKTGMDEAIFRFNQINNSDGIIISFDADTLCENNFFTEIEKSYKENTKANACITHFKHYKDDNTSDDIISAINQYELYLRYYYQALKFIGFPYYYFTIGSCFSVKANIYIKQGGMNKKQAGEDFYFLQKIYPLGNITELYSTCIYPSSRISDRVPFGTGPSIKKLVESNDELMVYNILLFIDLKSFLNIKNDLFKITNTDYKLFIKRLPNSISDFFISNNFVEIINEINKNSPTLEKFEKRFFHNFNAFMVIKYLNFAEGKYYKKVTIRKSAMDLLNLLITNNKEVDIKDLLNKYIEIEFNPLLLQ